jgi:hypothetical protein
LDLSAQVARRTFNGLRAERKKETRNAPTSLFSIVYRGTFQVTGGTTNPHAAPQLRRNSLGLGELVFQGVTHIAPATNREYPAGMVVAAKETPPYEFHHRQ